MVKVQLCITTLGWVLALITLLVNIKIGKGKLNLMKSTEVGLIPNPIPSILVCWGLSSFIRMFDEIILINDWLQYYSYRKILQGLGFWLLSVGSTWYLMGIIFNIPKNFTTIYYKYHHVENKPSVLIWVPTNLVSKIILYVNSLAMLVINIPLSFLAGYYWDQQDWSRGYQILALEQVVGATLIFFAFIKSVYYGYKLYKIVKLHDKTLLASKKVKSAFANMRNTFIFFGGFNILMSPAWLLLPVIYIYVPSWSTPVYLIFCTFFRIGVSLLNLAIIGNIAIGLINNLRDSDISTEGGNSHRLTPLSTDK
jgi:hypothetical protein